MTKEIPSKSSIHPERLMKLVIIHRPGIIQFIQYFSLALLTIFGLSTFSACQAVSPSPINTEPFVQLAENASCTESRNLLYVIDNQYVFWTSEGFCNDASYAHILYGSTVHDKLCYLEDSFVGPISDCDPELNDLFETILENLDQPDLGLGNSHSVIRIFGEK
jgi:hypothetical protein